MKKIILTLAAVAFCSVNLALAQDSAPDRGDAIRMPLVDKGDAGNSGASEKDAQMDKGDASNKDSGNGDKEQRRKRCARR